MGVPLKDLIETMQEVLSVGGITQLCSGGSSMPLLPKKTCDTITMDFDSLMTEVV